MGTGIYSIISEQISLLCHIKQDCRTSSGLHTQGCQFVQHQSDSVCISLAHSCNGRVVVSFWGFLS